MPLTRNYASDALRITRNEEVLDILDNGHTIQIEPGGDSTLTIDGEEHYLLQYHFHCPSEHTIDGIHAPMEMHFLHQSAGGHLVVLGVLVMPGKASPGLKSIVENLPAAKGDTVHLDHTIQDPMSLLSDSDVHYRYTGSLTTPPCSEGVTWMVMHDQISASREQIAAIAALIPDTNRPVQPLNGREVTLHRIEESFVE